jgi:hypothetical protein
MGNVSPATREAVSDDVQALQSHVAISQPEIIHVTPMPPQLIDQISRETPRVIIDWHDLDPSELLPCEAIVHIISFFELSLQRILASSTPETIEKQTMKLMYGYLAYDPHRTLFPVYTNVLFCSNALSTRKNPFASLTWNPFRFVDSFTVQKNVNDFEYVHKCLMDAPLRVSKLSITYYARDEQYDEKYFFTLEKLINLQRLHIEVRIASNVLHPSGLINYRGILQAMPKLEHFKVYGHKMENYLFMEQDETLELTALRHLDLSCYQFPKESDLLQKLPPLKKLKLQATQPSELPYDFSGKELESLTITRSELNEMHMLQIISNTTLTSLELYNCTVSEQNLSLLSSMKLKKLVVQVRPTFPKTIIPILNLDALVHLDIEFTALNAELAQLLSTSTRLESLYLSHHSISDDLLSILFESSQSKLSLRTFSLMEARDVTFYGLKSILGQKNNNTRLETLRIAYNEEMDAGLSALTTHTSLTTLELHSKAQKTIANEALFASTTVTTLKLVNLQMTEWILVEAIANNTTLTDLEMKSMQIGYNGVEALILKNKTLKRLGIDCQEQNMLVHYSSKNRTLEELSSPIFADDDNITKMFSKNKKIVNVTT